MSKIKAAFTDKKAVLGFLTAGDPTLKKTEEYIAEMEKAGAAIIEIGIPFSDPVAEGQMIQEANIRALSQEGGCTTDMVFDMVKNVTKTVSLPIVFVAYLNTLFRYGYDKFFNRCKECGVDGIIVQDMPFEEKNEVKEVADNYDVDIISIIVPSSEERIKEIARDATGYIYLLAPSKQQSSDEKTISDVPQIVDIIKSVTDTPVVVAVSNNSAYSSVKYKTTADGIIVGNGTVQIIGEHGADANQYVYDHVKLIVDAMK
ncbi:MAG: tryptophan synthase subunit alpha [Clostridia bacterium]|nr:tryptophan synthase subunit alpha [Clostridia bacterium]